MGFPRREHFRDTTHFAVATASEVLAPALRLAARAVSRRAPTAPATWRRALIVGHGHIGDVLCQTTSLGAIARGLPACALDYLTTPLAAEVLYGNPALHDVLPWNTAPQPNAIDATGLRALYERDYDAVLCTNVVRHYEALSLALTLRIPNRVAFSHRGLSGLATLPIRLSRPMTPPMQSRVMAEAITGLRDDSELRPRVYPTGADLHAADSERTRLDIGDDDTVIACSVTTRQVIGRVREEFFSAVLASIQRSHPGLKLVLCGSVGDELALRRVAGTLPDGALISAGRLGLRAFAAFLARTDAFFGMDSGPRHIANAARVRVAFVRNMAVREAEAGAYCPTEVDVAPSGDFLHSDEIVRALARIDTNSVARTVLAMAQL